MTTARKSRRPARKPARRNASCRAACGMSRKNPTTYARKLPSPFDRFTARDWAHVRETAETLARNWSAEGYEGEHPQEFVATSQGYVEVSVSHDGAYARSGGVFAWEAEWPSAPLRRASTKRSKRAVGSKRTAGSTRAKRTRKVNQRSNPRRKKAAGARKARRNPKAQSGFRRGQRVELHPGTDRWMMGDRYGTVSAANARGGKVRVKLDRSGESLLFAPDRLLLVD